MKQAIIDIGSNSIHLSMYDVVGTEFKILFREKIMAGLAGYVENGKLSADGIDCARSALLDFKETLDTLGIHNVSVFATASLRNISNKEEAVAALHEATDFKIVILDGTTEAMLGYHGAMLDLKINSGAFLDIGGASTEIIAFENAAPLHSISYRFGSLSLYKTCVRKIFPGSASLKRMNACIEEELKAQPDFCFDRRSPLVCVGGTSRTVMKIARELYHLPRSCHAMTAQQVDDIYDILVNKEKAAYRLILRLEPDRVHTIIPGLLIMCHFLHLFGSDEIVVSKFGVREGYLCQNFIPTKTYNTLTRRIGS